VRVKEAELTGQPTDGVTLEAIERTEQAQIESALYWQNEKPKHAPVVTPGMKTKIGGRTYVVAKVTASMALCETRRGRNKTGERWFYLSTLEQAQVLS